MALKNGENEEKNWGRSDIVNLMSALKPYP